MARRKLPYGAGSLTKVRTCTHGSNARCKCKWVARWRDRNLRQRTFDTYDEGYDFLIGKYTEKRQNAGQRAVVPKGRAPLLSEYGKQWLTTLHDLQSTSVARYGRALKSVDRYLGDYRIDRITHQHIEHLIRELYSNNVNEGTVQLIVRFVLRPLFRKAIDDGWRKDNPCDNHRYAPVPPPEHHIPTPEEVHRIANVIKPIFRLAVYLAFGTGMRQGEILGLPADCRKEGDRIYVDRQWRGKHNGGWAPLKHHKPGDPGRFVPCTKFLSKEIDRHIAEFNIPDNGLLFPSPINPSVPYNAMAFGQALRTALIRAGLDGKKITAHSFRHGFATYAIINGTDLAVVSRILGHKSYEVTYRTYFHLVNPSWPAVNEVVTRFLDSGLPKDGTEAA